MIKSHENIEEQYLGKKLRDLNIYEQRFKKLMQLMRINKMIEQAPKIHKKLPNNGHL
jgi:hypothetical protein